MRRPLLPATLFAAALALAAASLIATPATAAPVVASASASAPSGPQISVTGHLVVTQVDTAAAKIAADGTLTPGATHIEYALSTGGRQLVRLTENAVAGHASGSSFTGTLVVPDALVARLPQYGPELSGARTSPLAATDPATQAVLTAAGAHDTFVVASAQLAAPVSFASAPTSHSLYYSVIAPHGQPTDFITDAQITDLTTAINSFYVDQSAGQITSMVKVGGIARATETLDNFNDPSNPVYHDCDPNWDWYDAAAYAGFNPDLYMYGDENTAPQYNNGSARHIVILYPPSCGNSILGLGTIGSSVNDGGLVSISTGVGFDKTTLAHEIAHNLGLAHANAHYCDGVAEDEGLASEGCSDVEYGDWVDEMGNGVYGPGNQTWDVLSAFNPLNRLFLGFLPVTASTAVSLPGGQSTFSQTVNLTSASSSSGTQLVQVADPFGGTYAVEFRSGLGRDAGSLYTQGIVDDLGVGVRVERAYTDSGSGAHGTIVYQQTPADATPLDKLQYIPAGQSFTSRDAGVTVAVSAISGDTATVTISLQNTSRLAPKYPIAFTGSPTVGSTLTLGAETWNEPSTTKTHQWLRDGVPIAGATDLSYQLTAADLGHFVAVQSSASRGGYTGSTATSAPLCIPDGAFSFADVCTAHPFFAAIEWMKSSGISTGTPQPIGKPLYKPIDPVSRSAMAAFLYRYAGSPSFTPPADPTFADVDASHPFFLQIEWMYAQGISTGTPQGGGLKPLYKPADPVSRQAMAAFLTRSVGAVVDPTADPVFADVANTSTFYAAIGWMYANGISTGTAQPSGLPLYNPLSPVSRQAMAAFLKRLHDLPPAG